MTGMTKAQLNLTNRMERLPMTGFQRRLFFIICSAWCFDSMDLAMMTFVLAPIVSDLGLTSKETGLLGATSLAGMAMGAAVAGLLADRFGRKVVFQWSIVGWGLFSFACAASWDFTSLLAFRFFLGFFMGAEFPIGQAMISEIIPAPKRGRYIALLEGFFPLGFILAGVVAFLLLPMGGWRLIFVAEGVPAIVVLFIRRTVPESARWLEDKKRYEEAEKVVGVFEAGVSRAIGQKLPSAPDYVEPAVVAEGGASPLKDLFTGIYTRRTLMAWTMWFFALMGYYGITTWMGKFLVDSGFAVTKSVSFIILMTLWSIPGFLSAAVIVEKCGRKFSMILYVLLCGISCYLYARSATNTDLIIRGAFMQFSMFGMWSSIYAYTPDLFPTRARATGCGTSSTWGRVGAFIGPLLVPFILARYATGQEGIIAVFTMGGICFAIAALVIFILGPETKGKALEEISS